MKDGIILANGKSRKIKATGLPVTYEAFKTLIEGDGIFVDLLINALTSGDNAGWSVVGDYLNKANLLPDTVATKYGLTNTAQIKDLLDILAAHVNRHRTGGADALTAADIGALPSSRAALGGTIGTGWAGSGPYTIDVAVTGIVADATTNYLVDIAMTATDAQKASWDAANIKAVGQSANLVSLKAYGIKPVITIPIQVLRI